MREIPIHSAANLRRPTFKAGEIQEGKNFLTGQRIVCLSVAGDLPGYKKSVETVSWQRMGTRRRHWRAEIFQCSHVTMANVHNVTM